MFFYTSETPFHKVENDFLRQAFQILGCNIPHRRELAGKLLEDAYNRVKARVDEDLARVCTEEALALVYMALATDGWMQEGSRPGGPPHQRAAPDAKRGFHLPQGHQHGWHAQECSRGRWIIDSSLLSFSFSL